MYLRCHKLNANWDGSNIVSPDWIKKQKNTINTTNDDDKGCQYAATIALNHEEIGKNSVKISKPKPFISKSNWKKIHFLSEKDHWKKFEKNNPLIALNLLFVKKWIYALH